jgi:hypothetical protein
VNAYTAFYGYSLPKLTISADTLPSSPTVQTLAYTKPHHIYLTSNDLVDDRRLQTTIIHELFHAIKPDSLSMASPYTLQDGHQVIGYHGLSLVVNSKKEQTQFGLFEDAAAEACASSYSSEYQVPNVYYANIGSLMLKIIHR